MSRLDQQYSTPEEVRANRERVQAQLDFIYANKDAREDYFRNVAFDKFAKLDKPRQ